MKYAKLFSVVLAVAFVFFGNAAYAQKAGEGKIAYVDVGRLFDGFEKTKHYDSVLEKKYNDYEAQRNKKLEEIQATENKLSVLKKEEKDKQQAKLDKAKADLLEFDRQQQTDLKKERDEKIREILTKIENVVSDYAKKNNYSVILNDKVLIYADKNLDVTEGVLKELNK